MAIMEAGTLNCPECGAAVSSDSTQCQYCHALLQTVACPKCMGMMFVGTKFCPHCGANAMEVTVGGESNLACPRCHAKLQGLMVGKTPLHECMSCGGIWIDVGSFDHLCNDAEDQTAASGLQIPKVSGEISPGVHYLQCPRCHNLMNRLNYAQRSGIIMNVCKNDGIWLDRDELREIIEFIRAGGLTKANELNLEDAERAAKEQENDAREAECEDAVSTYSWGAWDGRNPGLLGGAISLVARMIR